MNKRGKYTGRNTPLAMSRCNDRYRNIKLSRLINDNFAENDYFIALHYTKEFRPDTEKAKENLSKFIRRLREVYAAYGKNLVYIKATRMGMRNGITHYMIFNGGIPIKEITRLWKHSERPPQVKILSDLETAEVKQYFLPIGNANIRTFEKAFITSRNILRITKD